MILQSLANRSAFHNAIPSVPMGRYAHFVLLRETESYPLFQTDGELNIARVSAGLRDSGRSMTRIVMFKRKQTTAERLTGRELLRRYEVTSGTKNTATYCEYNSEDFCKACPDCIIYGFAIGQEGSERSKVVVDSAFSLTPYDESHQQMTFNAPYESGTMSKEGKTRSAFGEQDHVLPQTYFPAVITLRDPTEAGFIYVLNNILRTKRYGAQTTRTGAVENHLVGVVFADGEIFSNLKFTQSLHDTLGDARAPFEHSALVGRAEGVLTDLLKADGVHYEALTGDQLAALKTEMAALVADEARIREALVQAYSESSTYATTFGAKAGAAKGKGKKAAATES